MNAFGRRLRITLFGESHGPGVGCVLDGVPPGLPVDLEAVQAAMAARRPGTGPLVSQRREPDRVVVQSGVHRGVATGAPLALWIANVDARGADYADLEHLPRPGHADWPEHAWSRGHRDARGGGHHSGRLTAPLVAAGALVDPLLKGEGVAAAAHLHQVGAHAGPAGAHDAVTMLERVPRSPVHTAHTQLEPEFVQEIESARGDRDSVGGVVEFCADGVPPAWGDPFFDGVGPLLGHLLLAVPAVKGVSFGAGFAAAAARGSLHNDAYRPGPGGRLEPVTNHAGGVLGGRTTGASVWGHVAVKPASSIPRGQDTVDLRTGKPARVKVGGRHDPCIAVRAVPVVQACLRLVLADLLLLARQEGHAGAP